MLWYNTIDMSNVLVQNYSKKFKKPSLIDVRVGDLVKVHQIIREGNKTRTQVFEGVVIRHTKPKSLQASILVRKVSYSVGVEKGWLLHSPNIEKIEIMKRSKVRRAFLTYLRGLRGKAAKLKDLGLNTQDLQSTIEQDLGNSQSPSNEAVDEKLASGNAEDENSSEGVYGNKSTPVEDQVATEV